MEENTLEESISRLLASIKESAEYIEFEKQKEILSQDSDLKKRVDAFRAKNYRIQSQCSSDQLFEVVEQMGKESAELRRISGCRACSLQDDPEDLYGTDRWNRF